MYVISFYVIAQFWLVHGQREGLAWWNFAFLFTITVMPFTSNLVGKFSANPLAVDIFAVNLLAAQHLAFVWAGTQHLYAHNVRIACLMRVQAMSCGVMARLTCRD